MESMVVNAVLGRAEQENALGKAIENIRASSVEPKISRGVFVRGPPGCGKTQFVLGGLRNLGYDPMVLGAGSSRNKEVIESLTEGNIAQRSVMNMFHGLHRPVVIVLDDVDCLGAGGTDKGAVTSLVRLIRAQKSRRHATHPRAANAVVCIGGTGKDKKTKEIAAACGVHLPLETLGEKDIICLANRLGPGLTTKEVECAVNFAQGDLHQLRIACDFLSNEDRSGPQTLESLCRLDAEQDSRDLAARLLESGCSVKDHGQLVCDVDRAILGLTLHENIPRLLPNCLDPTYLDIAERFAEADCLDRTGFQRQVGQLGEMSSMLKSAWTSHLLKTQDPPAGRLDVVCKDVRFTRVLTKYSSEFSNLRFIQSICARTGLDRRALHKLWSRPDHASQSDALQLTPLELNRLDRYFGQPARGCA